VKLWIYIDNPIDSADIWVDPDSPGVGETILVYGPDLTCTSVGTPTAL